MFLTKFNFITVMCVVVHQFLALPIDANSIGIYKQLNFKRFIYSNYCKKRICAKIT